MKKIFFFSLAFIIFTTNCFSGIRIIQDDDNSTEQNLQQNNSNISDSNVNDISPLLENNITTKDVINYRKKQEKFLKAKNENLTSYEIKEKIIYDGKTNLKDRQINIRKGFRTKIEFYDYNGNEIDIKRYDIGDESKIKVDRYKNTLTFNPIESYGETNLIIEAEGAKTKSLVFKISEKSDSKVPDTIVKIYVKTTASLNGEKDTTSSVLNDLITVGEIYGAKKHSFLLQDFYTENKIDNLFFNEKIKIYSVDDGKEKFLAVSLDNNYSIIGYGNSVFSKYSDTFTLYKLPFNAKTLLINTKTNNNTNIKSKKILLSIID